MVHEQYHKRSAYMLSSRISGDFSGLGEFPLLNILLVMGVKMATLLHLIVSAVPDMDSSVDVRIFPI